MSHSRTRDVRSFLAAALLLAACEPEEVVEALPPTFAPVLTGGGISTVALEPSAGRFQVVPGSPFVPAQGVPVLTPDRRFGYALEAPPQSDQIFGLKFDPRSGEIHALAASPFPALPGTLSLAPHPGGRFLYAAAQSSGVGTCVLAFSIDVHTGALAKLAGSPYKMMGSNCWSVAVHPGGRFLYVVDNSGNEDNTAPNLRAWRIDPDTGALTALDGSPYARSPAPNHGLARVVMHPSGRHLYVVASGFFNSLDDPLLISVLPIDPKTGIPAPASTPPLAIGPDSDTLLLDPGGERAVVAARRTGAVEVYRVNPADGQLVSSGHPMSLRRPVSSLSLDATGGFLLIGELMPGAASAIEIDRATDELRLLPGSPSVGARAP